VNAGGSAKGSFVSDSYYSGGSTTVISNTVDTSAVSPAVPQSIYGSNRTGSFTYTIPNLVPGAVYQVRLHFAETSNLSGSRRRFNVLLNGTKILENFDIVSLAGSLNKATVVPYACVADSSGRIVLQFSSKFGSAKVNAIEVLK
jgi:hypothetical protein